MSWFLSTLICLVLEGSYLGSAENIVINQLTGLQALKVAGLVGIPAFLVSFFQGLIRVLLWDYSFYTGGWEIIRYFWLATLTSAAVWGVGKEFIPVFANFLRIR